MANKPLTYTNYISIDGAEPVLLETLSEEQIKMVSEKIASRLSKAMSDYYSQHLDEFALLLDG